MQAKKIGRPLSDTTREVLELLRQYWRERADPASMGPEGFVKSSEFYDFLHRHYNCQRSRKALFLEKPHLNSAMKTLRRRDVILETTGEDGETRLVRPCGVLD
jgi:hypothetical protein